MARGGDDAGVGDGLELSLRLGTPTPAPAPRNNNLTIVYDQQRVLRAVDVVAMQAMAIISMASRETTTGKSTADNGVGIMRLDHGYRKVMPTWRAHHAPSPASPQQGSVVAPIPALIGDQAGLSMKRSLQRFLEKRKGRSAAASPYGVHRPAQPSRS